MHINVKNLLSLSNPLMLPFLLLLKQVPKKDLTEELARLIIDDPSLDNLIEEGYVKVIKSKKDADMISLLRLDKKGTAYLHSLEEAEVLDEDKKIFDWLSEIYKKNDKQIGNGKRTQRHIASFREKTDIEKNKLAFLCDTFIKDDSEMEWSFKLEYVFFKPTNAFQTRFVLEDSRLYKYYMKRKEFFDNKFKSIK
jgi:hypothetical protein